MDEPFDGPEAPFDVLEIDHPCGHREDHRIRVQDPHNDRLRRPTERETGQIRRDLARRPCNACLLHLPPGTPGRSRTIMELPEESPN